MAGAVAWAMHEKLLLGALLGTSFVLGCMAAATTCSFGGADTVATFKTLEEMQNHGGGPFECSMPSEIAEAGIFLALASSVVVVGALGIKLDYSSLNVAGLVGLSLLFVPIAVAIGALYASSFQVPFSTRLATYNVAWRLNFAGVVTLVTAVVDAAALFGFSSTLSDVAIFLSGSLSDKTSGSGGFAYMRMYL